MPNPKILDLDVLAPEKQEILYKGITYSVEPIQVLELATILRSSQRLTEADLSDPAKVEVAIAGAEKAINNLREFIGSKVKGIPAEQLTLLEMTAIVNFLTEGLKKDVPASVEAEAAASPEKKTELPPSASATG